MNPFFLMVGQTIQREARSKTLAFILGLTAVIIVVINLFLRFLKQELLSTVDLGVIGENSLVFFFLGIHYWSVFLGALFASNAIRGDQEAGVLNQLLALPIKRTEYFCARLIGTWLLVWGYYVVALLMAFIALGISTGDSLSVSLQNWPKFLWALLSTAPASLGVILLGMILSLFLPKLVSLLSTLFLTLFISLAQGYNLSSINTGEISATRLIGSGFYYLFPRIGQWNDVARNILLGYPINVDLGIELVHFVVSFGFCFMIGNLIFARRDL